MAFDAVNDLEHSLVNAATDPTHRPQFYRDFLNAEVFAVEHGPLRGVSTRRTVHAGENVALRTWDRDGQTVIPIFSSLPRLQAFIKEEANYLGMPARDLLELTRGAMLILNPGSEYGKEFTPEEVASLLDGSIWRPSERYVAQKNTQVLIGQPANYPTELVTALTRCFESMAQVRRAYLAHFFNPERDEKSHTLIALEVSGDWDHVVSSAGIVARSVPVPDPPIDFLHMTGKEGIEDHLRRNIKPFYEAKRQSRAFTSVLSPSKGDSARKKSWWRFW